MLGRLMLLAAAALWSMGGVLIKVLTGTYGVAPQTVACVRSALAGLALAWALPKVRGVPSWRLGGAGVAYAVAVAAFVLSTTDTTAANAVFLQYFYPLLVAVGGWVFFSERITGRTAVALAIGMAGVVTILLGTRTPGHGVGLAYGVLSAFAVTSFALIQRGCHTGSPVGLTSAYNLMAALLLLPAAAGRLYVPLPALGILAFMAVAQLGLPYVLFIHGLRRVPLAEAALITLLEPVLNPLWVWLGIGEVPHVATFLGGGLILAALALRLARVSRSPGCVPESHPAR